jgi:DNA mismatch repair protein MutS
LQVAQLAGVPKTIVRAARKYLGKLEAGSASPNAQQSLFEPAAKPAESSPHPVLDALADLRPDELSPREALEKLYALKAMGEKTS